MSVKKDCEEPEAVFIKIESSLLNEDSDNCNVTPKRNLRSMQRDSLAIKSEESGNYDKQDDAEYSSSDFSSDTSEM